MTPPLRVLLAGVIAADRRESMAAYHEELLRRLGAQGIDLRVLPHATGHNATRQLRVQRFLRYPLAVRRAARDVDVVHVVDHGYAHLVRFVGKPTVVTVHDLIPLLRWRGVLPHTPRGRPPLLNLFAFSALRLADRVLADSRRTARDAVTHAHVSEDRLRVAPLGLRAPFEQLVRHPPAAPPARTGPKRVLLSGSNFYKNHERALSAVGLLAQAGTDVVVVKLGSSSPAFNAAVERAGLSGRVVTPGWVDVAELPRQYLGADVLLFPSIYEGYGWPPFEAMACGVPVVATGAGALADEPQDAYLRVSPLDVEGMARALRTALHDDAERRRLIEAGRAVASGLSWERTFDVTVAAYREAAVPTSAFRATSS